MRRLIWDFAGRTYFIVGNLMQRLNYDGEFHYLLLGIPGSGFKHHYLHCQCLYMYHHQPPCCYCYTCCGCDPPPHHHEHHYYPNHYHPLLIIIIIHIIIIIILLTIIHIIIREHSGRVLDSRPGWGGGGGWGGQIWASPASLRCGPWARHIYPSLLLVQPRKTRPCLTERLLKRPKESNQTKIIIIIISSLLSKS